MYERHCVFHALDLWFYLIFLCCGMWAEGSARQVALDEATACRCDVVFYILARKHDSTHMSTSHGRRSNETLHLLRISEKCPKMYTLFLLIRIIIIIVILVVWVPLPYMPCNTAALCLYIWYNSLGSRDLYILRLC